MSRKQQRRSLQERMSKRVQQSEWAVFTRQDFADLAGYDQVGRGLRRLVAQGRMVRIGYGLYAKATVSPLSGRTVPCKPLPELASEALKKLKVEVLPSSAERAYNNGQSTQVPTGRVIGVRSRINRRIGYEGKFVTFEHLS